MKPRKTSLIRNSSVFALLISGVVFFTGCKKDISKEINSKPPESSSVEDSSSVSALAVGTYEGFGSQAIGGSNSFTVFYVTNFKASGSGSFSGGIWKKKKNFFVFLGKN